MTRRPPEILDAVHRWARKAEHDLITAQHTFSLDDDVCPFDTICFHAHQCIAKYLKALLTFEGTRFYRSHDLTELAPLLSDPSSEALPAADCAELNSYAVEKRYPDERPEPTRDEAAIALGVAQETRDAIRRFLPERVLV